MRDREPGTLTILIRLLFGSWRGFARSVATIAAVIVAGLAVLTAFETALFPWSRSFTGGPTLTGEWYGEFPAPSLGVHRVYVELDGHLAARCIGCNRIEGRARICDSRGRVRDFRITGDVNNWRGTSFWMSMGQTDNRDGRGVYPGHVEGRWEGDTITAQATLTTYNFAGGVAYSTSQITRDGEVERDPVVPLVLRRGTEEQFDASCGDSAAGSR